MWTHDTRCRCNGVLGVTAAVAFVCAYVHGQRGTALLLVATSLLYHTLSGHAAWMRVVDVLVVHAVFCHLALRHARPPMLLLLVPLVAMNTLPSCRQWAGGPLKEPVHVAQHLLGAMAMCM
jgi:hypothetical protein